MNQMKLNLSAKLLDQEINYNPFKQINLNNKDDKLDFLIQNIEREVKTLKKKEKKQFLKTAKATLIVSLSSLMIVNPTLATTTQTVEQVMPTDIMKIGMYLIGICVTAGTVMAIILSQLSGGYRMLNKAKEATEWSTNIMKGYVQILLAPVLIITIALLAHLLFSNLPYFVKAF
ncbi:hypothetical protein [Metabacillus fastidiosus]|uniref:hypothetical protein n=1 Tax=Metabacillus fastidiosus TaxID=1458 RepID=UPI003D2C7240